MKRIVFIFAIVLCGAIQAQTYDTVSGRNGILPHYYYPEGWFDTCIGFYETANTPDNYPNSPEEWGSFRISCDACISISGDYDQVLPPYCVVYKHRVDGPVAFTGVAAMMKDYYRPETAIDCPILTDTIYPDTVYILCPDSSGELRVVASASPQMDTTPHKVWKFPIHVDSAVYGFRYVDLYEHKFDSPVVVDSVYYLIGTESNMKLADRDNNPNLSCWLSHPYGLAQILVDGYVSHYVGEPYTPCNPSQENGYHGAKVDNDKLVLDSSNCVVLLGSYVDWWGPYLLMIDSCTIEVEAADSAMGTAGPTRGMSKWVTQTIAATPEHGYRFSHWNDGNTDNPRDIYLTQDTHFVAYFEPHPRYTVQTHCEPADRGVVLGDGEYWDGDTVTMTASAVSPYIFHHWNDGDVSNPRHFVINQDTMFVAYFAEQYTAVDPEAYAEALFTLTPNPATGSVCCAMGEGASAGGVLTVADAAGREVMRKELPPHTASHTISLTEYPKGVYFVTLTTVLGSSTQKLVVER